MTSPEEQEESDTNSSLLIPSLYWINFRDFQSEIRFSSRNFSLLASDYNLIFKKKKSIEDPKVFRFDLLLSYFYLKIALKRLFSLFVFAFSCPCGCMRCGWGIERCIAGLLIIVQYTIQYAKWWGRAFTP